MWKSKSSVAVACFPPGRAKDLSAPLYKPSDSRYSISRPGSETWTSSEPWNRCAERDFPNFFPRTDCPGIKFLLFYSGQKSEYSKYLRIAPTEYVTSLYPLPSFPVAARSKAWVCWRSLGEVVCSNVQTMRCGNHIGYFRACTAVCMAYLCTFMSHPFPLTVAINWGFPCYISVILIIIYDLMNVGQQQTCKNYVTTNKTWNCYLR
jgi:hypothetical protein